MYILILIVFIAELIIAFSLINLIVKADKKVCELNSYVEAFNPLAETFLQYFRCLVSNFHNSFEKIFNIIKKKQKHMLSKTLIIIAVYGILLLFKIKPKKAAKIYRLAGAIQDIVLELAI